MIGSPRRQKAIERKLMRRQGMSDAQREAVKAQNEQFKDWTATCRRCGAELEGTLEQMKGHVCGTEG